MLHEVDDFYQLSLIRVVCMGLCIGESLTLLYLGHFEGPDKISQKGFFQSYAFWKEGEGEGLEDHFSQGITHIHNWI